MSIVWIIDTKTREDFPIAVFETNQEAINYRDELKIKYPDILFFHSGNGIDLAPHDTLENLEEVIGKIRNNL